MADYINEKVIGRAAEMLSGLLNDWRREIETAYCRSDDALSISLSLKFKPKASQIEIDAGINFVSDRVKDGMTDYVDPHQMELFQDSKPSTMNRAKVYKFPQRQGFKRAQRSRNGLK